MTAPHPRPWRALRDALLAIAVRVHAFLDSAGWDALAIDLELWAQFCRARAADALMRELGDSLARMPGDRTPALDAGSVPPTEPPQSDPPMLSAERDTREM